MAFQKAKALQEAERSVAQGKTAHAIKQYQEIFDNDPSDVSLLNTVGDLYIRDRNITEGLRQFHRLAESYVREGFNVKAIAIYRKISKVDPHSMDAFLKLADLYQRQGLNREAREQYLQAVEFFTTRKQTDRVLEILKKLVQLDPANASFRNRLASEYEQAGRREEAAHSYVEAAESLLRRDDRAAAETALSKAAELDPSDSKIQILRARVDLMLGKYEEAERIIIASPELQSDISGKRILLDSYLGSRKLPEAQKILQETLRASPADFTPVAAVCKILLESENIEGAYSLLLSLAEPFIVQNNSGPLLEALRRVWSAAPHHIPTMELIRRICERTADEVTLPEVLEALGRAYEEAGDLEKAEAAYRKLAKREPEKDNYRELLNEVQQKLGKETKPVEFPLNEMAPGLKQEGIAREAAPFISDEELMVKAGLENSDLFSRYHLTEKAIAELEKVLKVYPDQIEIHRRVLELSRKGLPERGAAAAAQLARIFAKRGDAETASKYQTIASAIGAFYEIPPTAPSPDNAVQECAAPPSSIRSKLEACTSLPFPMPVTAPEKPVGEHAAPPPAEIPFDLSPPVAQTEPPFALPAVIGQTTDLDLSGELEAMAIFGVEAPAPSKLEARKVADQPPGIPALIAITAADEPNWLRVAPPVLSIQPAPAPAVKEAILPVDQSAEILAPLPVSGEAATSRDLEDGRVEIEFYIEHGFLEEAREAADVLEVKYPGRPFVAELRRRLHRVDEANRGESKTQVVQASQADAAESRRDVDLTEPGAALSPEPAPDEWELPTSYAALSESEPTPGAGISPPVTAPSPAGQRLLFVMPKGSSPRTGGMSTPTEQAPANEERVITARAGPNTLADFAADLASSLDGLALSADTARSAPAASGMAAAHPLANPQGAAQLSGLLEEIEGSGDAAENQDDPETHYSLGVAFREMGLLDESIGEFQKVVKLTGKRNYPPNFLPACSLLAICFMEKRMPAIAVRWYLRALETPNLDEDALMALQYDLGIAYEGSGDSRSALERYTDVYSQNIDFRDVAEKLRALQQKT